MREELRKFKDHAEIREAMVKNKEDNNTLRNIMRGIGLKGRIGMNHKRRILFILSISMLLLLSGCFKHSEDMTTLKLNENIESVNSGSAINTSIYVSSEGKSIATSLSSSLSTRWLVLDGKIVLQLPSNKYNFYKLSAGKHTIQVVDDKKLGKKSNKCEFELEEGKGCYVVVKYIVEKNGSLSLVIDVDSASLKEFDY